MVGSAPPPLLAITLPTGLTDNCAPASEVRFTFPLASSFREGSQPWALQRVKLARTFSHPSPWVKMGIVIVEGAWYGGFLLQRAPILYFSEGGVGLPLRVRGGLRDMEVVAWAESGENLPLESPDWHLVLSFPFARPFFFFSFHSRGDVG